MEEGVKAKNGMKKTRQRSRRENNSHFSFFFAAEDEDFYKIAAGSLPRRTPSE